MDEEELELWEEFIESDKEEEPFDDENKINE